jgi:predicted TPR repeat methyltransferase
LNDSNYSEAAEFYDILYQGEKDYAAEAGLLSALIRELHPVAATLLDVGCGSGSHARALSDAGFAVDGVDPEAHVANAAAKRGLLTYSDLVRDVEFNLPKPTATVVRRRAEAMVLLREPR